MSIFRVTAQKSGGWWALTVEGPGLSRPAYTQVRRLDKAEDMVRDLLALHFDRGYAHREIGVLLGVSHQAVGKLLGEEPRRRVDA
ncbi:hypothetical protein [Herbidospora sp. NBRC 101105]|uniref:hypothetical protein n=1 Tax=Herbidospora sp. NBRC 101105 TaxID=3032195 RepID=UPI0024A37A54|nr:hypothetical protein [Herbidospora sp. NBRC 101105]GLX97558.1 hypothetical protein Hesp01_55080 [Herbidospora sp. NBRC 101105]